MTDYATKINALLAKAASTTHEGERQAFTEGAERLMVKWGIDDAMLDMDANAQRNIDWQAVKIEKRRYDMEGSSGALLAELVAARAAAGIAPVQPLIWRGQPTWWCVGHVDDLARIDLYVPHLVDQARSEWKRHWNEGRKALTYWPEDYSRARIAFLSSFGWAVKGRLEAMFKAAAAEESTGSALVLVANRMTHVENSLRNLAPGVKNSRSRAVNGGAAYAAGHRSGMAATIAAGAVSR